MSKIAVYPGSFDPPHNGHLKTLFEAIIIFDKVTILLSINPAKKEFLSLDEKCEMWDKIRSDYNFGNKVEICSNEKDLTTSWMKDRDLQYMIRGVRNSRDFDEEMILFSVNRRLYRELTTIFIPNDGKPISSSIVRELVKYKTSHSDLCEYVPYCVANKLVEKFYDK